MTQLNKEDVQEIVRETVKETLLSLGADVENPLEMQQDFQTLREWRLTVDSVRKKAMLTGVAIIITGLFAAIVIGIRSYFR